MPKMRVPRLWRNTISMILLFVLLTGGTVYGMRLVVPSSQCVQAISQDGKNLNLSSTTLNAATGDVFQMQRPVLSPDGILSPDGRFSAIWWQHSAQEDALAVAALENRHTVIVGKTVHWDSDVRFFALSWSSHSQQLAFIESDNGKFTLSIVNAYGQAKRSTTIQSKFPIEHVYLMGWSADNEYIAGVIAASDSQYELRVWKSVDLSEVSSGIAIRGGWYHLNRKVVWAKQGHKLVFYRNDLHDLGSGDFDLGTLVVWSPENGTESERPWRLAETFVDYMFHLSPDGQQFALSDSSGEAISEAMIGIREDNLVFDEVTNDGAYGFLGWSDDSSALYVDRVFSVESYEEHYELLRIHMGKGLRELIDNNIIDAAISPDGKKIAYNFVDGTLETGFTYHHVVANIDGTDKREIWRFKRSSLSGETDYGMANGGSINWSPNSEYIAPFIESPGRKAFYTVVASAARLTDYKILPYTYPYNLLWVGSDWILYYSAQNPDHFKLMNLRTGKVIDRTEKLDPSEFDSHSYITVSPDQKMMIYPADGTLIMLNTETLNAYKLKNTQLNASYRLFQSGNEVLRPSLVRFEVQRSLKSYKYFLAWSPDSTMLAYLDQINQNDSDLVVVTREGKELHRVHLINFHGPLVWTQCD